MDLRDYLLISSYAFSAAVWGLMWRELKRLKDTVEDLRLELARQGGLTEGQEHEKRITRLEQASHAS